MRSDARKKAQERRAQAAPSDARVGELAGLAHRAFHEAWTLPEPLNLYADSPIWQHLADVIAREWLPERERAASEKAWDEAHRTSCDMANNCWGGGCPPHENPYRERADREEQGR